jgi:tRNA (guanine-N7-)-methyltransferase
LITCDLYNDLSDDIDQVTRDIFHIKTHYEKLFTERGSVIKYCKFKVS